MIKDPFSHAEITNKSLCFHCGKWVDPCDIQYNISFKSDINKTAGSDLYTNSIGKYIECGYGSILRFHVECFSEVAGEEYLFDLNVWK